MAIQFYPTPIDEVRAETAEAFSLYFRQPDPVVFQYKAGQYLTVKVDVGGESLRRAFSMSSSPLTDDRLRVTIKRVPGGRVSNHIWNHLRAGDTLEILPPMGNFYVAPEPDRCKHYILIGAGSGITPLMAILKTVLAGEPLSKVSLWYCNRDEASIIFKDELLALSRQYADRLLVYHSLTQPGPDWKGPQGRLDKDRIYQLLLELFMEDEYRKEYYLCGPQGLMEAAQAAFDKHAVNPDDVHRELYSAPAPTAEDVTRAYAQAAGPAPVAESGLSDGETQYELITREIEVRLNGKTKKISVKPDQYILDAAIAARMDPPYACQSGICTTCRAMLHTGVVSMDETEGLSARELEQGYILTCQAHPLTDDVSVEYM
jgi:ring-1,2-phenylacetyl-CoA epoxidase subunit PaaE